MEPLFLSSLNQMKAARQLSCRSRDIYSSISNALSSSSNPKDLHKIHSILVTFGLSKSLIFLGKLISKYSQFRDPGSALLLFRDSSCTNDAYLWNTIIRAMTHNRCYEKALQFYAEMRELGVKADSYTFPSVINVCGSLMDFERGRVVHEHVLELGYGFDLYISNALIDMYARCNELGRAQQVFDGMPRRDIVSWNCLISGYTSNGYFKEALEIYHQLRMGGLVPDSFSFSTDIRQKSKTKRISNYMKLLDHLMSHFINKRLYNLDHQEENNYFQVILLQTI